MSELPKGWIAKKLADVAEVNMGQSPKGEFVNQDMNGMPFYQGKAEFGSIRPSPRKWCTKPTKVAEKGDILMSIRAPVGPTNYCPEKSCIGRGLAGVRAYPELHQHYLFYYFKSIEPWLSQQGTGSTFKAISGKFLRDIDVKLAPLEEQKRIADKLDSVLAKVEAAQARLDKIPTILKRFRQSVLAAATSGELTKEWREERNHSTEDMLSGFEELAAPPRYASRNKGFIFGINATSVGTPSTAAVRQWKWVPLVKVAQMSSGHTPSRSKPEYWGGSINWLGIKDAREHHSKEINSTIQKTNELGVSNSATRILPKGTICISRTASVGYVVKLGADMCTSQDFVNWTCSEVVDADWLKWLFVAEKEALFKFGKGTTHTTVYFPEWLSINILLPPIEEQQEIVRIIDGLFCKADRIERQFNDTKLRINKLTQSILAKAFKGELLTSSVDSDIEAIESSVEAIHA